MTILGLLLILLALPLIIGFFTGGRKNKSWRNLSIVMLGVGAILLLIGTTQ